MDLEESVTIPSVHVAEVLFGNLAGVPVEIRVVSSPAWIGSIGTVRVEVGSFAEATLVFNSQHGKEGRNEGVLAVEIRGVATTGVSAKLAPTRYSYAVAATFLRPSVVLTTSSLSSVELRVGQATSVSFSLWNLHDRAWDFTLSKQALRSGEGRRLSDSSYFGAVTATSNGTEAVTSLEPVSERAAMVTIDVEVSAAVSAEAGPALVATCTDIDNAQTANDAPASMALVLHTSEGESVTMLIVASVFPGHTDANRTTFEFSSPARPTHPPWIELSQSIALQHYSARRTLTHRNYLSHNHLLAGCGRRGSTSSP